MMDTTESFTDKINAGAALKNIAFDCIALNLPGAIKGAMTHLGKNLAKIALEHYKQQKAESIVWTLIKYHAMAEMVISSQGKPEYVDCFSQILTDAYHKKVGLEKFTYS